MGLSPAHTVAIALACLGLGLIVAAVLGEPLALTRLLSGIGLVVVAMITSGLHALNRYGASTKEGA